MARPGWHVVLRSRLERRPLWFPVTCGGDVQSACGRDEILGGVGFVRAYGGAALAGFLFVLKRHQQRSFALGASVGLRHHGGGDQAAAVLHQRAPQICGTCPGMRDLRAGERFSS